jgi:hypothetical protein
MADKNPTTDQRVVRLDMSIEHRMIVRNRIETWRDGELDDLKTHPGMENQDAARQRVATYGRLIEALRLGRITLPDDDARLRLTEAAISADEAEEWEESKVDHDSLWSLVSAVGGKVELTPAVYTGGVPSTTAEDDRAMEAVVLSRVLEVHPAHLSEDELVAEIVGEEAQFGSRDAVERAARDLAGIGLLHIREELITPTRAALRSAELQDQ